MFNSKTVTVRLTKKELTRIDDFRVKYGIEKQNDFFRGSSAFFISMFEAIVKLATDDELNSKIENFNNNVKNELENVPKTKAKLQGKYDEIEKMIIPCIEEAFDKTFDSVKAFTEERSAGRPPNPKAGPGRPKDTGY